MGKKETIKGILSNFNCQSLEDINKIMKKGYEEMANINLQIAEEFAQLGEGNEVYGMDSKKTGDSTQ